MVLVADKGPETMEIKYDDILKEVIGASLDDKVKERTTEIENQKTKKSV
mgnify:CR=1 FL=1